MRALFIGGTGTISAAISRRVLDLGWELYLLNRGPQVPQTCTLNQLRYCPIRASAVSPVKITIIGGNCQYPKRPHAEAQRRRVKEEN
jgi:hypothetical protein